MIFLVFEVSISNRPEFRADQGSAIENHDKCLFWPPEGFKVRQTSDFLVFEVSISIRPEFRADQGSAI